MTKAKRDPVLAALIAKLPATTQPWPRAERIAWLRMMAMAFDVAYGPCGGVRIAAEACGSEHAGKERASDAPAPVAREAPTEAEPPAVPLRFHVDRDGFAMGDGRPIAMEDLPAGATLWDERTGIECGDVAAILWRDIGTTRRTLPLGVTLKPAFDAE
jgi:hypothetical protein